jgi:hypothetical protein
VITKANTFSPGPRHKIVFSILFRCNAVANGALLS